MSLLLTNFTYVFYRLAISGPIVHFLHKHVTYYQSVFIMAQLSFMYDTLVFGYYFNAINLPSLYEYVGSDIIYTIRVLVAWWLIKQVWDLLGNYWISIFLVAELTFIADYFIFENLFI